jgi:hypothetical protein
MLEDIGPGKEPPLPRVYHPDLLNCRRVTFTTENLLKPIMLILGVVYVNQFLRIALLAESEVAGADVDTIIVIYRCCTYMFILTIDPNSAWAAVHIAGTYQLPFNMP